MDKDLLDAAMQRAAEVALYFSHTRPDGSSCFSATDKMEAENIAGGQSSATAVMTSWMNSAGHRANILTSYFKTIGIGCFTQGGTVFWVQCFGTDTPATISQPADKNVVVTVTVDGDFLSKTKLRLDSSNYNLKIGNKKTVKLYVQNPEWASQNVLLDNSNFTFKSYNTKKATISATGKINAKTVGKYKIKATLKNATGTSVTKSGKITFPQPKIKVNSQNQKYYYYAIEQGTPDEDMEVIYDHGEPTETTVAFTTAITNRGYTDIPVSKTWRDDSDAQGLRPETLKLTLYRRTDPAAQGEVAGEVTLSAKNAQDGNADVWTYTFEHLPDTDGSGNPYTYWVEEEHLESYTVTGSGTLALTNTLGGKETEIAIQGRKTWVGDGADDRPNSITLSLLQNGTKVAEREVTPNADGSWTYDFGSWPAYDDSGRAYTYTVQEEPVDGYGSRVDGWNVINGKGNLTVKKQVYSGDRQRDFSFTVTLDDKSINGICGDMTFQDGVAAFTLKDGESKTAKGLPSGVGYTVAEARVDGYGTRVEGHNPGTVPFGDTAEALIINYDDTTPPPDPDPDPDPKPDPDPGPDPMPDPDPHPTPDPDESPDPDMPDTPDEPGHPDEPDDSVPTGDTAQLALYLALLAASLAGAAAIVILGRKGRKRD